MELKSGYKQTEVGVIPEDWEVFQFNDHFLIYAGGDVPKDSLSQIQSEEYPYPIYANAIQNKGLYGFTNRKRAKPDSVTITARGYLGHAEYRETPFFPIVRLLVLEPNGSLDATYTTYAINDRVNFSIESTGVPQLTAPQVGKYAVAAPTTLPEQRAIATALSDVDALLNGLDRLIAKKRDLKQAAMQQLLTGKTRLPGFEGEWEVKRISELLCYERPDRFIVKSSEYEETGSTPVLTANKSFILGYTYEDFGVYFNLPVIIFDDFTTDSKYVDFPFKVKSSAIKILKTSNLEVNLKFIFERMRLIKFPLGEHKRYYISEYQSIELLTPKLDEQTAITQVLSDMDAEIVALEQRRNKTKDIKQAMMQELLTGKTRLVTSGGSNA